MDSPVSSVGALSWPEKASRVATEVFQRTWVGVRLRVRVRAGIWLSVRVRARVRVRLRVRVRVRARVRVGPSCSSRLSPAGLRRG